MRNDRSELIFTHPHAQRHISTVHKLRITSPLLKNVGYTYYLRLMIRFKEILFNGEYYMGIVPKRSETFIGDKADLFRQKSENFFENITFQKINLESP